MKRFLIFLSALLITGCVSAPVQEEMVTNAYESEEFGVYVRLFQKEAETRKLELSLPTLDRSLRIYKVDNFSKDLEKQYVIGLCVKTAGEITIYISKTAWNEYDSQQREMLLFHELGHCVLNLEHDKSLDSAGVPNDIMYPINFDSIYYFKYRKFYLDRMFKKVLDNMKDGGGMQAAETISTCRWGLKFHKGKIIRASTGKDQRSPPTRKAGKI